MLDVAALIGDRLDTAPKLDMAKMDVLENARRGLSAAVGASAKLISDAKDCYGMRLTLRLKKGCFEYDIFSVLCKLGDAPWIFGGDRVEDRKACASVEDLEQAIAERISSPFEIQNLSNIMKYVDDSASENCVCKP